MRQKMPSEESFEKHREKSSPEQFLEDMDQIIPWKKLAATIAPFYPNPKGASCRPIGVERIAAMPDRDDKLLNRNSPNNQAFPEWMM